MDAAARHEVKLARRRGGRIMAVFYQMVATWLYTEKIQVPLAPSPDARAALRRAMWTRLGERYRAAASDMGGLLIKVGQLLSARADLFPTEFTSALRGLQDEVPGVAYEDIKRVVEQEFGEPIGTTFGSFDPTPLAAASLGQVHRATLPDGRPVVVKVLRPGVDTLIRADLEGFRHVTRFLLRWTRWAKTFDLAGVYYESVHILLRELDLRDEAQHTRRFARMFEGDPQIRVPTVFDDHTRQRVLTLSFMEGVKATDRAALEAIGVDPSAAASLLVHALSRQVLGEGFFHADPHPGNLLVAKGPDGPIVTLLDFGMVGQLTPRHKHAFKRLALGLLQKDPDMVVAAFDEVDMLRPGADRAALRRALAWLMEKQMQGNLFELRPATFLEIAKELRQIISSQAFQFPADIAFLGRGTSTTFGVCRSLDPDGDFIRQVEGAIRTHIDPAQETTTALAEVAQDLARLPARLDRVLTVIEKGGTMTALGEAQELGPRAGAVRWGAGAAVAWLGGNQWWAMGSTGLAIACWAAALFAAVMWVWRRLPPSPAEP